MKPRTPVRHKAALILFGCILSVVMLEVGMRLTAGVISSYQSWQNLRVLQDDDRYRILCLGESTTFFGAYKYSYPAMLEQILNAAKLPQGFRVFNEGRIGTDTDAILEDLPEHLDRYRPHMVIVMMGINDTEVAKGETVTLARGFLLNMRVVRLMRRIVFGLKEVLRKPDANELLERAYLLISDADINRVKRQLERAKEAGASPADMEAVLGKWYWLGEGKYDQAIESYEKALSYDPNSESIYEDYFEALYYGQRYAEAAALMVRMVDRFPKSEDAYRNLGKIYLQMEEYAKLMTVLEKAEEQIPEDPGMLRIRAIYHLVREERTEAERYFKKYAAYEQQNVNPRTAANYRALRNTVLATGAKLIAVQYPMRDIGPLRAMLDDDPRVIFVSNERNFKEAVQIDGYRNLFTDHFAGDFGHLSDLGNEVLASTVFKAVVVNYRNR